MISDMKICLFPSRKEEIEKLHVETRYAQVRDRIKGLLLGLKRMDRKKIAQALIRHSEPNLAFNKS